MTNTVADPSSSQALLILAAATIRGLADQQAMTDDWYLEPLAQIDAAIAEAEKATTCTCQDGESCQVHQRGNSVCHCGEPIHYRDYGVGPGWYHDSTIDNRKKHIHEAEPATTLPG